MWKWILKHIFNQSSGMTIESFFDGCTTPEKIASRVAENIYPLIEARAFAMVPTITLQRRKGNCYDQASLCYEGLMWLISKNKFSDKPYILTVNGFSSHTVCVFKKKGKWVIIDSTRNPKVSWKDGVGQDRGWYYESDITDDTKLAQLVKPEVKTFHFSPPYYGT